MERKLLISGIPWEKAFTILCISVSFPSCCKELIHIAKRFSHKSWLQCNIAFRKESQLQNVRTGLASIQISIIFTQLIRFHNIFSIAPAEPPVSTGNHQSSQQSHSWNGPLLAAGFVTPLLDHPRIRCPPPPFPVSITVKRRVSPLLGLLVQPHIL